MVTAQGLCSVPITPTSGRTARLRHQSHVFPHSRVSCQGASLGWSFANIPCSGVRLWKRTPADGRRHLGPIHWRSPVACSPSEGTDATTLQLFHTRRHWTSHVHSQRFCSPTDQKTKTPASENDPAGCKLAFSKKRVARLHFSSLRERGGRARWRRTAVPLLFPLASVAPRRCHHNPTGSI